METLIDDMDLRHDGRVDALPFCFDAGGTVLPDPARGPRSTIGSGLREAGPDPGKVGGRP